MVVGRTVVLHTECHPKSNQQEVHDGDKDKSRAEQSILLSTLLFKSLQCTQTLRKLMQNICSQFNQRESPAISLSSWINMPLRFAAVVSASDGRTDITGVAALQRKTELNHTRRCRSGISSSSSSGPIWAEGLLVCSWRERLLYLSGWLCVCVCVGRFGGGWVRWTVWMWILYSLAAVSVMLSLLHYRYV